MLDSIRRLRDLGSLVAYSARKAGRDVAASTAREGRTFNRGWRGAARFALNRIIVAIRDIRADCDHDWLDDFEHQTETSLDGRIIESWHAGSRTCKLCGVRERIEEPCNCAEPEKRDSGLCQCRGERCNC